MEIASTQSLTYPTHKITFGAIEIGYLALSTIYGLKRAGIYSITPDAINIDDAVLHVKPLGTDIKKCHIIPKEIIPVIHNFKEGLKMIKNKLKNFVISLIN